MQTVSDRYGIQSVSGQQQILNAMLDFLATAQGLQGTIREDLILRQVCQRVQVDEVSARQLGDLRTRQTPGRTFLPESSKPSLQPPQKLKGDHLAERELLEIILVLPELADYIRHRIGPDDFEIDQHRQLLELCFYLIAEEGILPEPARVVAAGWIRLLIW
ncbi:MAG: hypothetical protein R3C49_02425 [Planctomycetaceae bacterium]